MLQQHRPIRNILICLALLALGLRSLIPVGYMPDFSDHAKGFFPITICDGIEHIIKEADAPCPMHHSQDSHHHGLCPFGASAIIGFTPLALHMTADFAYTTVLPPPCVTAFHASQSTFSNASPRSPPYFS